MDPTRRTFRTFCGVPGLGESVGQPPPDQTRVAGVVGGYCLGCGQLLAEVTSQFGHEFLKSCVVLKGNGWDSLQQR